MSRFGRFSFLTDREKEVYGLLQELGSQRKVAERLGIVDSAVASTLKSVRLKVLKLFNTLQECLELGLLTEEDLFKQIPQLRHSRNQQGP